MAAQPVNAEPGNDFGCHDVSLQRLSKVSWTEEAPVRPPPSINEQLKTRRYDVATLMSIRATMNPGSVQLRINPAALTEVFKSSNQRYSFGRGRFRSRTGTLSGNFDSTSTNEDPSYQNKSVKHWQEPLRQSRIPPDTFQNQYNDAYRRIPMEVPLRQPYAPPKTPFLQKDQGFANFIKQHASPTHVRVTAGGRIVPTGQPPIMSDLGATRCQIPLQNGFGTNMAGATAANSIPKLGPEAQAQAGSNEELESIMQKGIKAGGPMPILTNQWGGSAVRSFQQQMLGGTSGFLQALYPFNQVQFGQMPPTTLGDGSIIHMQNGVTYRSYFNGFNVVTEVLNSTQQLGLPMGPMTGGYSAQTTHSAFPNQGAYSQLNGSASTSTRTKESTGASGGSSADNATKKALQMELEDQRSRLTALDKHIALHRHRLSPTDYSTCVTQHKHFVEIIDSIRMKLDSSDLVNAQEANGPNAPRTHTIKTNTGTYIATNHGTYETYDYLPLPSVNQRSETAPAKQFGSKQPAIRCVSTYTGENARSKVSLRSGGLSPVAPSFVPSGANTSPFHNAALNDEKSPTVSIQTNMQPSYVPSSSNETEQQGGRDSSQTMESSTTILEFCKRRQFSPSARGKFFCSTEDEFAAVIHRVREQAEMLGCKGGQSKDPAYDAEQDIRWAMADGDPIPLAEGLPEYFFNPRPWNWEDSEFNYRVPMRKFQDDNKHLGGCHRVCVLANEPVVDPEITTDEPEETSVVSASGQPSKADLESSLNGPSEYIGLKAQTEFVEAIPNPKENLHLDTEAGLPQPTSVDAQVETTSTPQTPVKSSIDSTPLKDVSNVNVKINATKLLVSKPPAVDHVDKEQVDPKGLVVQSKEEFEPTTPTRSGRAARHNFPNRSSNSTHISDNEGQTISKSNSSLSPSKVGVPRFLQKLLRSPRQRAPSSVQTNLAMAMNKPLPTSATLSREISKRLAAMDNGVDKPVAIPASQRPSRAQDHYRAPNKMYGIQPLRSQKAQSSIARTELHSQGYVPHVQRATFSAPRHLQPNDPSPQQDFHFPQYDGADDMAVPMGQSESNKSPSATSGQNMRRNNESRNETVEEATNPIPTFQTYQQDLPRDHGPKVEHFFKKLIEEERKEMAAVAAKDGKA